jgi:hypothetical protein
MRVHAHKTRVHAHKTRVRTRKPPYNTPLSLSLSVYIIFHTLALRIKVVSDESFASGPLWCIPPFPLTSTLGAGAFKNFHARIKNSIVKNFETVATAAV